MTAQQAQEAVQKGIPVAVVALLVSLVVTLVGWSWFGGSAVARIDTTNEQQERHLTANDTRLTYLSGKLDAIADRLGDIGGDLKAVKTTTTRTASDVRDLSMRMDATGSR